MKTITTLILLLFTSFATTSFGADTPDVQLYPNPSNGVFTLSIQSTVAEQTTFVLVNLFGQVLTTETAPLSIGSNLIPINWSRFNAGIYILRITGNGWSKTIKIAFSDTHVDSLDAVHYNLNLTVRNLTSKTISGWADIILAVRATSVQTIKLDLLKLTADSVVLDGLSLPFSQTDSTLNIQLAAARQQGDTFTLAVYYQGQPVTDASWGGFYFNGNYAYNMGVAFTSNPHNFGRCWFPCFDNFTDRATYSFHITTDPGFKGVCNGLMLPETPNGDGSTTWNWELNQSIPTYLASVAVGQYEFVQYTFTGINRTYPVWLAVTAADTAKARASFTNLNNALACFESKFGAYPFDRVGYVGVPFTSGAMEHAANIAYPLYAINGNTNYETLFAHELSHMWWGDLATCQTAEDMWLNEGWASFCEALFLECMYGKEAYTNDIKAKTIDVLLNAPKDDGGWLPVSGIPHTATYGTHVYKKGALMVHTLRTLMGDSAFFAACKQYLQTHQYMDVSSEDLKNTFQAFTAVDLNNFFVKWIYSPGHSDVVVSDFKASAVAGNPSKTAYHIEFREYSRINNLTTDKLPFSFFIYKTDNTNPIELNGWMANGMASFDTIVSSSNPWIGCVVNKNERTYLGSYTEDTLLQQTGSITLSTVLMSLNVQNAGSGTNRLAITHHWIGAPDNNLRKMGIRISTERYWSVTGHVSTNFSSYGFFNYNGLQSSYLDVNLIQSTEDSLVLLYRSKPGAPWSVHTNNTFQPGTDKTDKIGRFWVKDLKTGEYAFGIKDHRVVGLAESTTPLSFNFSLYPNPTDTQLNIEFEKPFSGQLQVVDVSGKIIHTHELKNKAYYLYNTASLKAGTYFIIVQHTDGKTSQSFVKE